MNSILIFLVLIVQSAIYDHPGHTAVRRVYAAEERSSGIRFKYADRLRRVTRSRKWVKCLGLKVSPATSLPRY